MERCHGKTKSGDRCRRSAREGSRFCAAHVGQAEETTGEDHAAGKAGQERDPLDTVILVAVAGFVVWAALVFRRLVRLL